jgi:hypothetical protein
MWEKRAGSSRSIAPASTSHFPPWESEPSRLAIFASTLDSGLENSRASEGTGSGARFSVPWP